MTDDNQSTRKTNMMAWAAMILILLIILSLAYIVIYVPPEYQCLFDKNVDYGMHGVTFVVIDIWGNPLEDMLVELSEDEYRVTGDDGSCKFYLFGKNQYNIMVYNETMNMQKNFKLYPIKPYYQIIL